MAELRRIAAYSAKFGSRIGSAELGWQSDDIFALPHSEASGLAYCLETELVTALGPEHAVTESKRVFDRVTRQTWMNPRVRRRAPEYAVAIARTGKQSAGAAYDRRSPRFVSFSMLVFLDAETLASLQCIPAGLTAGQLNNVIDTAARFLDRRLA